MVHFDTTLPPGSIPSISSAQVQAPSATCSRVRRTSNASRWCSRASSSATSQACGPSGASRAWRTSRSTSRAAGLYGMWNGAVPSPTRREKRAGLGRSRPNFGRGLIWVEVVVKPICLQVLKIAEVPPEGRKRRTPNTGNWLH